MWRNSTASFWSLVQEEKYIKYINCFTSSGPLLTFLGLSERYKLYLLGSIVSFLIGCLLVEKLNCKFLILCQEERYIKYINCFTNSGPLLEFLSSSKRYKLYLLGSIFSLLIGYFFVEQINCEFLYIKYINCFTDSGTVLTFFGFVLRL